MGNKISESIKRHRRFFGETQEQLARYLGRTKSAISNYEKDKRQLTPDDLEKLSEHYLTTTDDLIKGNAPEYIFKHFDMDFFCKQIEVLFPAFGHPAIMDKGNDESFIEAVTIHRNFLALVSVLFDDNAEEAIKDENIDPKRCWEGYLRAVQKEKYNLYCKANMVGLFYVRAMVIYSMRYVKEVPESLLINLSGDPNIGERAVGGWDKRKDEWEPVFNGMRSEHYIRMIDNYLKDLSASKEFKDLAEYYRCWRYILDLVGNDDGRVANLKHGSLRMIECGENGNLYASICISIMQIAINVEL